MSETDIVIEPIFEDGEIVFKQEETKQEETKQEETKQEETKQEETKQEETKQEETKQEETKQEETKQEERQKEEEKKEEEKKEVVRLDKKGRRITEKTLERVKRMNVARTVKAKEKRIIEVKLKKENEELRKQLQIMEKLANMYVSNSAEVSKKPETTKEEASEPKFKKADLPVYKAQAKNGYFEF